MKLLLKEIYQLNDLTIGQEKNVILQVLLHILPREIIIVKFLLRQFSQLLISFTYITDFNIKYSHFNKNIRLIR